MNIFSRDFKKIEDEKKKREEEKVQFEKLRKENLSRKDIAAIFFAMLQLMLPIALGIIAIYFFVIEFLTKVWFKY